MFKNKTDRLNYGNLLIPPTGYELTKAVATTYSLDLETLTAATIALGVQENTDSVITETPVALLHALQKVTGKVVIFCEAGQTKLPETTSPLVLLLEKMIVSVAITTDDGRYASFHPKTWTLEYENVDGERLYRFIVLSRNLTFDRSWDVTFMMEGTKKYGGKEKVLPLKSFLQYLKGWVDNTRDNGIRQMEILEEMQKGLDDVKFELDRREFLDFEIMPLGIGKEGADMTKDDLFWNYPEGLRGKSFQELIIMSPFLSTDTIMYLNNNRLTLTGTRRCIFTRRSELPKIKDVANNFDVYVLKDTIIDGEEALPDGDEVVTSQQDIHAKMYLRRKYSQNELYLGSMNCSSNGLRRNVEMMIRLSAKAHFLNMDTMCQDLWQGEDPENKCNPFEKVDLTTIADALSTDEENDELEHTLKSICRMKATCQVEEDGAGYRMVVRFDDEDCLPENVEIGPMRVKSGIKPLEQKMVFEGLGLLHLSEFFTVTVKGESQQLSRVIMIPTTGIPEQRDRNVVQGIIKDKKTFIEYVAMALGDDLLQLFGSEQEERNGEHKGESRDMVKMPALYEKMLHVAYEDPRRLNEIESIMQMIDNKEIVTDEFKEMYETFRKAMKLK